MSLDGFGHPGYIVDEHVLAVVSWMLLFVGMVATVCHIAYIATEGTNEGMNENNYFAHVPSSIRSVQNV